MNQTIENLLNHTSIRRYLDKPIEPEILDLLLKVGIRASSAGNLMNYSLMVLDDKEKMKQIAEDAGIKEDLVQNPIYNTIFIKLIGELSKLILQKRDSTEIINQLTIINSYSTYWKERLKSKQDTKTSIKNFQKIDEDFLEEIDDYFANVEINFSI